MNNISQFLQERIDANDFPSAVYLVAEKGEIVYQDALGYAVAEPDRIEARLDTIYDIASLTKPLVTGFLCAKLIENTGLELTDKIGRFFGRELGGRAGERDLKSLLTHTSGYPGWKPFYLIPNAPPFDSYDYATSSDATATIKQFVLDEIFRTPPEVELQEKVIYSDLNFLLLGFLIEEMYGWDLQTIALREIFSRLVLLRTFFCGTDTLRNETAASEKGNEYEKRTCIELGYLDTSTPKNELHSRFRDYLIWGEVHDGNAYYLSGFAGHAGLFSTAKEVFKIALQFLPNYTTLLKPETCELFRTNLTPGMNEARSIAFQLAETPESTAGSLMPPETFGHLGFTGTSLWIDPVNERIFILLTNRTHAHPLPFVNINSVRRRFHDLAVEALDKKA